MKKQGVKRLGFLLCLSILVVILVAACGNKPAQESGSTPAPSATGETSQAPAKESAPAVRGVTKDKIKVGAIIDLSGPFQDAGMLFRRGAELWFRHVNDEGGINGRKFEGLYEDSRFQPPLGGTAANKLIHNDKVFALIGVHGSAVFASLFDLVEKEKVLSLSFGHSTQDYDPLKKMVFQVPTSYFYQTARIVDFLYDDLKIEKPKVGILYQDDAFGLDNMAGVDAAAKVRGMEIVAREKYKAQDQDLSIQTLNLKKSGAEQIIIAGAYVHAGVFIKEAAKIGYKPITLGASPNLNEGFADIAGAAASNDYYAANPFALPGDPEFAVVENLMKKYNIEFNPQMMYGFVNAATLTEAVRVAGDNVTPEGVAAAMEKMKDTSVAGYVPTVTFGPDQHYASKASAIFEYNEATRGWTKVGDYQEPKL